MDFQQWFNSIPFFTRHFMVGVLAVTTVLSFQILGADKLLLTYDGIFNDYFIWTIFTNFLVVGAFSFQFLMSLYLIYYAVGNIEKYHTPNKYADFIYLLLVCMGFVFVYSLFVGQYYAMSTQLVLCLLYIYCKKEPLTQVRFLFGFVFKNAYLPWVILVYELLTGQSIIKLLIGIAAGHTYIVLKDILPNSQHKLDLLATPNFLKKLVAQYGPRFAGNNFGGFGANNQMPQGQQPAPFRFFRGPGVRLG